MQVDCFKDANVIEPFASAEYARVPEAFQGSWLIQCRAMGLVAMLSGVSLFQTVLTALQLTMLIPVGCDAWKAGGREATQTCLGV